MGEDIKLLELWVGCSPHEEFLDKINELVVKVNDIDRYLTRKYNEEYEKGETDESE